MKEPRIVLVESPGLEECQLNAKDVYEQLIAVRDKACRGFSVIYPGEITEIMKSLGLVCAEEHYFEGREAATTEVPF